MAKEEGFRDVDELTVGLNNGYEPVSVDEPVKKDEPVKEEKQEKARPVAKAAPAEKKEAPLKQGTAVKKKAKKKTAKKKSSKLVKRAEEKKKPRRSKKVNWVPVAILALVVVVLAVLAYLYFSLDAPSDADRLAAMVNGEPIYMGDLESRHNFLLNTVDPMMSEEEALNQMIEEKLLSQYARSKGYSVTNQEVEEDMDNLLAANNLQKDELLENLDLMGVDYADFVSFNRDRLLITRLIEEELRVSSMPTDEEVRSYYDSYPEQFGVPEMVQVRHILIAFDGSDNETYEEAQRILNLISDDRDNFCGLVAEYTDDIASAGTCGEYNFSRSDPLVPEFLEAGFDMEPGDIRNVRTQFGYHVMYKVSDIPGDQIGFDEIEQDLSAFIAQQKLVGEYQDLVADLRRAAIIEVYSEEEAALARGVVSNGASVSVKEVLDTDEARKMNLARCLGDLDAQLFKVYWCPYCNDQIEMFGEHIKFVDVVECDPDEPGARPGLCREAGIQAYPTWVIGGETYQGMRTLNALAALSGCEY